MNGLNGDNALAAVQKYLECCDIRMPFFVAFNAEMDLVQLKKNLSSCSLVRLSDFCSTSDVLPDIDRMIEEIRHSVKRSVILLGIGEYTALTNDIGLLNRLVDLVPDQTKVVVPLWNGHRTLDEICGEDPRMRSRRCVAFTQQNKHWSVKIFRRGLPGCPDVNGFKALLQKLEAGYDGELNVVSSVRLDSQWSRTISSAYELFKIRHPDSPVPQTFFSEEQWTRFCDNERVKDSDIESADQCLDILNGVQNKKYLQLVLARTERYSDWKHNLMTAILSVSYQDNTFRELYEERKKLISNFDKGSIEEYVMETRRFLDPEEQIHYLTTSTQTEINEIMVLLSKCEKFPEDINWIYPDLWDYIREFKFQHNVFSEVLSDYFNKYKQQKVKNQIEQNFNEVIKKFAERRPQFFLPTRESVLEKLDGENAHLFWVDAMGCEWLGYLQAAAERNGMEFKVTPTRAMLPTITSINRGFYDEWKGPKEQPIKALDKIKHGEFEKGSVDCTSIPVHLSEELKVMERIIGEIKNCLKRYPLEKVVLTSDHGATRLAVIADHYTIWEMPEKGKHGGRCCKNSEFSGDLPPCSTESDDGKWHVLAGLDRFRGGHIGDVEVHGGATLEEMIVPVVELKLLDSSVRLELLKKSYKVTFHDTEITLEFFSTSRLSNPSVEFQGTQYPIVSIEGNDGHYLAKIPKVAAGEYTAEVYNGDVNISKLDFSVISGGATINKMDDFF